MGSVRRLAVLPVLLLLTAAMAAVSMPRASANTALDPVPGPVKMNYACALKPHGLLRYVSTPAECDYKGENPGSTLVTIAQGPHYACVRFSNSVFLVASLSDCPVPKNRAALTLPPMAKPVYFCARKVSDLLSYTSDPRQCPLAARLSVVVPVQESHLQPPVLATIESAALQYIAGTPPVPITASLTVRSPGSAAIAALTGATVRISSGLVAGTDSLGFTNRNGISGSYKASSGVLTLTGSASLAAYQAALRSVSYRDSNAKAAASTRKISFQASDGNAGNGLSNVVSRTVLVTRVKPPVAVNDTATTGKNSAADINVLANDTDPAGLPLTVASVNTTGTKGTVSINKNGTVHYDPNGQFAGLTAGQTATDTFTYKATDGFQTSNSATVTVTITGTNDAPVLSNVETTPLSYQSGTPAVAVTSTLTASDDDATTMSGATVSITSGFAAKTDSLSFASQNGITGSYNATTGVLTLTGSASTADYQAALRSVEFATSDHSASPAARNVSFAVTDSLGVTSAAASRTVDVTEIAPPVAADDTASTDKNSAVDINVLANDTDPAGLPLTVGSVDTTGTLGTASINPDGTIHYDPNGQFAGLTQGQTATDTFTYKATDGTQTSHSATVTVTITGSNDLPVISGIETTPLTYQAGTPPVTITSTLAASDDDATTMSGATVAITSGFDTADDTLSFTSQNGITGSYNATTGVLTLTGSASTADYQAALRSVEFATSDHSASPAARNVSFTITDSLGATSTAASRTVDVTEIAPPVAADDTATTSKNSAVEINVLANDTDPAGLPLTVASINTTGTTGQVSVNGNGTIHYDPNGQFTSLTAGQSATDTFTYTATDGTQTSNSATVTVTITGSNDLPVLSSIETTPLSYQAGTPAVAVTSTLTASDDDATNMSGATISITAGFDAADDTLSFTNQNGITGSYNAVTGVLTLTGSATTADYQAALRSVKFATSDPSASPAARNVSFTVTDSLGATSTAAARTIDVTSNSQPPTVVNQSYTAVGNTTLGVGTTPAGPTATVSGSVLTGDSDSDPTATLSVTANTTPAHGTVTMNPNGTFTYVPNAGYSGSDSFQVTIAGSNAPSKTATATVTITVGTLVWYVNNSNAAAGNGEAATPFNTLAAANTAAGANSIIFLYQGSGSYAGGVTLHSGEDLFGQPHGLTVGGYSLVSSGGLAPTITNSGGDGIDLAEGADVEGVNVTSPSGNGIAAGNVNDATVGTTNSVAISGATGDGIHVSGGNGTLNFGTTSVTGSAGHSVSAASRSGGTITFGGHLTDAGSGVSLSGNGGATVAFTGTLTISTGTKAAFTATGGGTVTATGTGSTIATTTGTAVTVTSTTIGAAGLTFQSVSSNGANPGISLNTTGSSGGLTVTGTGTAGSGGTIQNSAGEGIALSSTSAPSFTDMMIKNNAADGINGSQVTGFTLADSTVSGNGTQASVNPVTQNDDGLNFSPNGDGSPDGLTGTVSITNSVITGSADNNAIISDTSGTLNLTVTGSTFSTNNVNTGNDGLRVDANAATNTTVNVTGSTFINNIGRAFTFEGMTGATGTNSVTFSSNVLNTTSPNVLDGGVDISPYGNSHTAITVNSNNIQNPVGNGIGVDEDGTTGTLTGTIGSNVIGTPGTANSGGGVGIGISAEDSAAETLSIINNDLYQYDNTAGIYFLDREGNSAMKLTITGNLIADPGQFGSWGIYGVDGALNTDNGVACAAITGNSIHGSGQVSQGGADIELDQNNNTTIKLPGYTGSASNTSAVQTFLQGNNSTNGTPTAAAFDSGSGGEFVGGSSC